MELRARLLQRKKYTKSMGVNNTLRIICLVMLACLVCCGKKEPPPGVLSRADMAAVMTEIYLTEARLGSTLFPRDSLALIFKARESAILDSAGISQDALKLSYEYYLQHPDEFELVYETVVDSLNLREQRARNSSDPGNN